ncbi:GntR family transcriptional regulator [Aneurinibacillus terranovensis]|uniref:GntR family transcriptional regulator n=1 Tax=Aneurinibacillus terranovensis TaxID=278991 RepID=UPI000400E631|nr:GntR family transcriptional regulator [Aneurinibacillus terranovensis]
MSVDKKSRVPFYAQLIDIIIDKISTGELKEYDRLPSERELCDMYGISRTTIRQAMIELENEGYIYKEHGKGTFVAPQTYTQSLRKVYSFSEEMKKLGKKPVSDVISFNIVQASSKVARRLELEEEEEVYEIIRLRLADDEPIMYETTYLPGQLFPGLTKRELETNTMYDLLRSKYKTSISHAQERFKAVSVSAKEASYLHEKEGAPAMEIERIASAGDRPIEYTTTVARGNKYVYTIELS